MGDRQAHAALDAQIRKIRKLPNLGRTAAPRVAEVVAEELNRQIRAGVGPDGKPWKLREDGGQALATAGKSLAVVAIGPTVFASLRGHVARHHRGRARGGVERPILPSDKIPPRMADAIGRELAAAFAEVMA